MLSFKIFHWIILLVLIVYQDLFLISLLVVFSCAWTSHAVLFIRKIKTKVILRPLTFFFFFLLLDVFEFFNKYFFLLLWSIYLLPGTVHSSIQQFALHFAPFRGAKVRSAWLEEWFWKLNYQDLFESFSSKPIITLNTTQK